MLDPQARHLYLSELRPPDGYTLDRAIATTFTLDLMSLLMAPLSMILAEEGDHDTLLTDPIAVLEALRRTTGRLAIFCQAGRISVPTIDSRLYSYLEPVVIGVQPPGKGVFHPKVWILRFVADDGSVLYRLLCLSRNLTFDRSWDTILSLEGELDQRRKRGFGLNRPLRDFVQSLPDLALYRPISPTIQSHIHTIADEIGRVWFDPPPGIKEIAAFIPSGIPGYKRQPALHNHQRMLVMSPFLSDRWLTTLADYGHKNVLISRQASLDSLSVNTLNRLEAAQSQIYIMQETAEHSEFEDTEASRPEQVITADLSGLHAKLFIVENGWYASVLTGSANATTPAFNGNNVEFMVELRGKKSHIGIERLLDSEEQETSLHAMLQPYRRLETTVEGNELTQRLEHALDQIRQSLLEAELYLTVSPDRADIFRLILQARRSFHIPHQVVQVIGRCCPISLDFSYAQDLDQLRAGQTITFAEVSLIALTGFLTFELTATSGKHRTTIRFVLNVPVNGLPAERDKHILRSIISDRSRFIRYLLLLLAEGTDSTSLPQWLHPKQGTNKSTITSLFAGLPLLEELVRASSRQPEKIRRIAALVDDLKQSEAGRALLPEGFEQIWDAFIVFQK